jgi:hypothetical protein
MRPPLLHYHVQVQIHWTEAVLERLSAKHSKHFWI